MKRANLRPNIQLIHYSTFFQVVSMVSPYGLDNFPVVDTCRSSCDCFNGVHKSLAQYLVYRCFFVLLCVYCQFNAVDIFAESDSAECKLALNKTDSGKLCSFS